MVGMQIPAFGDPRLPLSFWARVAVDPVTGCWVWQGKPDDGGYGNRQAAVIDGVKCRESPHRWAYRALIGPIPEQTLNHRCLVKLCCFPVPSHCGDPMSIGDNSRDARARITHCPKGHPYDFENTFYRKVDGRRECRQCMRDRIAAQRAADPEKARAAWTRENQRRAAAKRVNPAPKTERPPRTHCAGGHDWNEVNIGGGPGDRYCRPCLRARARARRQVPPVTPREPASSVGDRA